MCNQTRHANPSESNSSMLSLSLPAQESPSSGIFRWEASVEEEEESHALVEQSSRKVLSKQHKEHRIILVARMKLWHGVILLALLILLLLAVYASTQSRSTISLPLLRQRPTRPIAILHVGPRKTASTTIQSVFNTNATRSFLSRDNFHYVGKNRQNKRYWADYLESCVEGRVNLTDDCRNDPRWTEFTERLDRFREQNVNIIISDEGLLRFYGRNDEALDLLVTALDGWDVRIVTVYRRFYEWTLSEYSQISKRHRPTMLRGFLSWYREQAVEETRSDLFFPLETKVVDFWKSRFPNVEVFNMHEKEGTPLMERFLCEHIREAGETCAAAREGRLPISTTANQSPAANHLDAEEITLRLKIENMVPNKLSLDALVPKIEEFLNRPNVKIPRKCLEFDELEDIELKTLRDERDVVMASFSALPPEMSGAIRQEFRQTVKDNRFCDIEWDLAKRHWSRFFERLRTDF